MGHSCLVLESGGFRALLDPYREVQGLPDVAAEADAVYCSHDHFDHGCTENIRLTEGKANPFAVKAKDSTATCRGVSLVRASVLEGYAFTCSSG